jgi:hypothetical protein
MLDLLKPECNVRIIALKDGKIVDQRETHNVITNVGRNWLRNLVGASSYPESGADVYGEHSLTDERVRYMAFGVGGALSSDPYFHSQEELVTVTSLEDFVAITDVNPEPPSTRYLIEVMPQTLANQSFPTPYSIRFSCLIDESLVSFDGNLSYSGQPVGTSVPISEAGLYISGASPGKVLSHEDNTSRLVAYDIFAPITITPNITLRVEWEFRF